MDSGEALVEGLVKRFAELAPVYKEHLKDNRGELLPHVIFWHITQATLQSYLGQEPGLDWQGLLRALDTEYQLNDLYVQEIIDISFLGSLPAPGQDGYGIVGELPNVLHAAFNRARPDG